MYEIKSYPLSPGLNRLQLPKFFYLQSVSKKFEDELYLWVLEEKCYRKNLEPVDILVQEGDKPFSGPKGHRGFKSVGTVTFHTARVARGSGEIHEFQTVHVLQVLY